MLFFHAMGVTGASSEPIARYLQDRYFCILPTSTVYCEGQKYVSKLDEIRQVEDFLHRQGVERLAMVVASSIGADLAMAFLTQTKLPVEHAFFDGGQFAQIGKGTRRMMTPFLYFAIKSLYWSKGGTLKKILWCDDDSIKPYFIDAGKNLTYTNLRRQISDSLEDKPFPSLPEELQRHIYFEFGSISGNFQNSLETTSLLKELGAKCVVSRAERDVQAKFLLRNGADHVVYPEKQVAKWAAIRYTADHIFDYIEIDEQHAIFEVEVPEGWVGKSIGELNIRSKFGINILGIKHSGKTDVSITPDTVLSGEITILALGEYKALQKCFRI